MAVPAMIEAQDVKKAFGGAYALRGVTLEVAPREVHAIIGQNGSGKSTLIKILSGYYQRDSGSIRVRGETVPQTFTAEWLRHRGVSFLHQDLGLVPTLSVLENLRVGRFTTGHAGNISWRQERELVDRLLLTFGLHIDCRQPLLRLSQAQQTVVGIVRAFQDVDAVAEGGLVVLDEPTSALPSRETEILFTAIRRVKDAGHSVVIVTHHLEEVFAVADRVTVFRNGEVVCTEQVAAMTERSLVQSMLGGSLHALTPMQPGTQSSDCVLRVDKLDGQLCSQVSFEVRPGEIVGLTGLLGSGHDELPYLLYGATTPRNGVITIRGVPLPKLTPRLARRHGIALLPAGRQTQSGIPRATVRENVSLPRLREYMRARGIDSGSEKTAVEEVLQRFNVQPPVPGARLETLSGGNQQKALLGRWIATSPELLILHEPSNGVDVGARQGIFEILQSCARDGMGIVVASSQYDDIAAICTRVLVFSRGKIIKELAGGNLEANQIAAECYGEESRDVAS